MTSFTAHNTSAAVLKSDRAAVWKALTDPALLPELTPYLKSIEVDGDRWIWRMAKIPILGTAIAPYFTEVMEFTEPDRIEFRHDPARTEERTGVDGTYLLADAPGGGTDVSIDLSISCDLPLSAMARRPVETAMNVVVAGMGRRFAANLLRHLGE